MVHARLIAGESPAGKRISRRNIAEGRPLGRRLKRSFPKPPGLSEGPRRKTAQLSDRCWAAFLSASAAPVGLAPVVVLRPVGLQPVELPPVAPLAAPAFPPVGVLLLTHDAHSSTPRHPNIDYSADVAGGRYTVSVSSSGAMPFSFSS